MFHCGLTFVIFSGSGRFLLSQRLSQGLILHNGFKLEILLSCLKKGFEKAADKWTSTFLLISKEKTKTVQQWSWHSLECWIVLSSVRARDKTHHLSKVCAIYCLRFCSWWAWESKNTAFTHFTHETKLVYMCGVILNILYLRDLLIYYMSNINSVVKTEILNTCKNFKDCRKAGLWNVLLISVSMYLHTPSIYILKRRQLQKYMLLVNIFSLMIEHISS